MSRPSASPPRSPGLRPVLAVTALWASLLLGASLLWPPLTGYDEAAHVGMAGAYAREPLRLYAPDTLPESRALLALRLQLPSDPARTPYDGLSLAPRGERPTLAALGGFDPAPTGGSNQMVQHPPLGYAPYAAVLRLPGVAGLAWDRQVWLLRLLSVAMALPVPALAWATARRLLPVPGEGRSGRTVEALAVVAAVLPLTLPNLVRVGASVSNDVPLGLATSVLLLGLARVVTGDLRARTALLVAAGVAAALWTKGFALVLPPVVVIAYLTALRTWSGAEAAGPRAAVRRHRASLAVVLAGLVVGGLWWLRNLVVYHRVQVDAVGEAGLRALYGPPDEAGQLGSFLRGWPYLITARIWGGVGLPDTPVPSGVVVWGWPILVGVALLTALVVPSPRRGSRWGVAVVAVLPLLLTLAVVGAGSFAFYHRWSDAIRAAQGRYVYSLVTGLAAAAAVGPAPLLRFGARWRTVHTVLGALPVVVLAAALATQASTWAMLLATWFTRGSALSAGDLARGFGVLLDVSPVPVAVTTALLLVLPVVTGVGALVAVAPRRDNGA